MSTAARDTALHALVSVERLLRRADPDAVLVELKDAVGIGGVYAVVVGNGTDDSWPIDLVRRRCRDASALISFMPDRGDDAFLAACPRLRIIACALKGFDNFDVAACTRHGVWITAVPDLLTAPTAELAVGLTIGLARHIAAGDRWVRGGGFRGCHAQPHGPGGIGGDFPVC